MKVAEGFRLYGWVFLDTSHISCEGLCGGEGEPIVASHKAALPKHDCTLLTNQNIDCSNK